MKFKNLMLVLAITVSIIFVTVVGATYAYYVTTGGSVDITTGSINPSLGVVFNNSDHIDLNTGIPISSEDVITKAARVTFTLTPDKNIAKDFDIGVSIRLSNINIDNALKVNDFKYRLVCNNTVNYNDSTPTSTGSDQIFNGNASSITSDSHTVATLSTDSLGNNKFTVETTDNVISQLYNCTLYVWLEESGLDQNTLMGKHFGANVEVLSTMKKR